MPLARQKTYHPLSRSRKGFLAASIVTCLAAALPAISLPQSRQHARKKPAAPIVTGISPDVVVPGSAPTTIRLRGTGLNMLSSVSILDCDEKHTQLRVDNPRPATFTVTIPNSLLKPCVLQVSDFFPLGVADPHLAKLKPPHNASINESLDWSGWFNHVLVSGDVDIPPNGEVVNVRVDTPGNHYVFVLGKHDTTLFRVNPLKTPVLSASMEGATEFDLFLPGVKVTDVQWGGDDEGFWIGTLSKDGTQVEDRRLLSSMTDEPSGPLDQN
jgi:hypothetical protein